MRKDSGKKSQVSHIYPLHYTQPQYVCYYYKAKNIYWDASILRIKNHSTKIRTILPNNQESPIGG